MSALTAEIIEARRLPPPAVQKAILGAAGVSQVRVARELGVHRTTVVRWVTGSRSPRGALRRRYRELLEELQREVLAS